MCPDIVEDQALVIVVDKSEFELGVYRDGHLATGPDGSPACFPVALGAAPVGDKARQGDERTPEGTFRVTHRNPSSSFHLSLGLSYPDAAHAVAAFAEGRVDAATRDRVVAADRPGRMPARDTPLGGDIYIHGGGPTPRWWTDGCVAVADEVMDWLFAEVGPGSLVRIQP
jgi:murein L,D-transpeptidase YafK